MQTHAAARSRSCSAAALAAGARRTARRPLKVLATVPTYGALAREIGGDLVEVTTICRPAQDVHSVAATPSLVERIRDADLLLYTGLDLEIWLDPHAARLGQPRPAARRRKAIEMSDGVHAQGGAVAGGPQQGRRARLRQSARVDRPAGRAHRWPQHVRDALVAALPEQADAITARAQGLPRPAHGRAGGLAHALRAAQGQARRRLPPLLGLPARALRPGARPASLEPKPRVAPTASHLAEVIEAMKKDGVQGHPARAVAGAGRGRLRRRADRRAGARAGAVPGPVRRAARTSSATSSTRWPRWPAPRASSAPRGRPCRDAHAVPASRDVRRAAARAAWRCGYDRRVVLRDVDLEVPRAGRAGARRAQRRRQDDAAARAARACSRRSAGRIELPGAGRPPRLGYVPQTDVSEVLFPVTAFEVVLMGLAPRAHAARAALGARDRERRAARAGAHGRRGPGRSGRSARSRAASASACCSRAAWSPTPSCSCSTSPCAASTSPARPRWWTLIVAPRARARASSVVVATHSLDLVANHADHVALFKDGARARRARPRRS